ncbi:hypothetical protein EEL30_21870 [Brevibacillus laterosporus]|uniref:Uncharacterized protein n=1 Tax=Brevibacillus laterosporus TaxID=1465 RepID=A0A518VCG6_BRELA|nr:hypothetical protein EEL30_21870 [Brevibacillus laterosporus]
MNFLLEYYVEGAPVHKAEYTGSLRSALRYALNSISSKNAIANVVEVYKVENGEQIWIKEYGV